MVVREKFLSDPRSCHRQHSGGRHDDTIKGDGAPGRTTGQQRSPKRKANLNIVSYGIIKLVISEARLRRPR